MNKNKEKLESFTAFCEKNPELRFWQALLAWTKENYKDHDGEIYNINVNATDTFYWE